MNQKCNDLGNVFLFRGKKTSFTFVLPLLLFTNYPDSLLQRGRHSDRAVTLSHRKARELGPGQTRCPSDRLPNCVRSSVSAHSHHIKHYPALYQEETGFNVCFNKPAANLQSLANIFLHIFAICSSVHPFGDSC